MKTFTLNNQSLSLDAAIVPWDSESIGVSVGQINRIKIKKKSVFSDALTEFEKWRDLNNIKIISCRLDHDSLSEACFLEEQGFHFIEMLYPVSIRNINLLNYPESMAIEPANESDLAQIQYIAKHAFSTGRFNVDPHLTSEVGGRRYAKWVLNSFNDPCQQVVKASDEHGIIGFFITEDIGQGNIYWHLTAIAPEKQGLGLGKRLWRSMIMRHHAEGFTGIRTLISARNIAVINLYAKLGFCFDAPMMTFHWVSRA